MIESEPGDLPFPNQTQNEFVGGGEKSRLLHAHSHQLIDIEEPAIIDFVGGGSPIGEAIGERLEQLVKAVRAGVLAALAVERRQGGLDVCATAGGLECQLVQALALHFL